MNNVGRNGTKWAPSEPMLQNYPMMLRIEANRGLGNVAVLRSVLTSRLAFKTRVD